MKARLILLIMAAFVSSLSLCAQSARDTLIVSDFYRYEGRWPSGQGMLYSLKDGLVIGPFVKGKPDGKCVCYRPNGEVYWGNFKKGKATGKGRIYRDNGIVVSGDYKKFRYHGLDTLYRNNGSVLVAKFRKGKLRKQIADYANVSELPGSKPRYPMVDLRRRQEDFLKDLEISWEQRNLRIAREAGLVHPKFQGGDIDDFALWVNSRVRYPEKFMVRDASRTVLVEFTVTTEGKLTDVHAVFGSDSSLNAAAEDAVRKSPLWTPGEYKGNKRNVRMTVPVVFTFE